MDEMLSELTSCCSGGQRRSLLLLCSGKRALEGESETVDSRLAEPIKSFGKGISKLNNT